MLLSSLAARTKLAIFHWPLISTRNTTREMESCKIICLKEIYWLTTTPGARSTNKKLTSNVTLGPLCSQSGVQPRLLQRYSVQYLQAEILVLLELNKPAHAPHSLLSGAKPLNCYESCIEAYHASWFQEVLPNF